MSQIMFSCFLIVMAQAVTDSPRPVVGAIRWDGWHGEESSVGLMVEKTLSPKHWHHRLPFFGRVVGENAVEARGNTQEIMDKEIEYASAAGLDYWAFVTYPEKNALSLGLKQYLSSEKKELIRFCLNLQGGWESTGGAEAWHEKVKRYVKYFQDPMYQTVLKGRPLVFLYSVEGLVGEGLFETWEDAHTAFDQLREATLAVGIPTPYIVAQGWYPPTLKEQAEKLGIDAIGAYASNTGQEAGSYKALADHTEHWWDAFKETGVSVVPLVTAGWDMRPRVETPTPWVKGGDIKQYHEAPTPDELAAHLQQALIWCRTNSAAAQAQTVLIYAWNEFDEGGWLCPTIDEGTARLDAVRKVLTP
ncbi:MAG: glycoside hydrolase family 99-like domain-containing protein [Candidatus Hydrogenedentes bacterium]|nr:glycoside hydrolase family 99-like domain-containing protein [Candidatus Hydrogenedentota bacterium]